MDEIEAALEYIEASFAIMDREVPHKDDKTDVKSALAMCIHWTALGQIASLPDWLAIRNPPEPSRWPAGTMYPD